jgi:transcriptional regulator CtsR
MINRYIKVFNAQLRSRDCVYDSNTKFYEINKFIDEVCSNYSDKVSQDLLDTICSSLIFNRKLTPKQVHEMLNSSLESSLRQMNYLKNDYQNRK